jgi:hypothetical protein
MAAQLRQRRGRENQYLRRPSEREAVLARRLMTLRARDGMVAVIATGLALLVLALLLD